ncbi:hypothetical protein MBAV_005603, partial [Candidatus Magnetobacterium bavaricum]
KAGLEKAKKALAEIFKYGEITDMAYQFLHNLTTCPAVKNATLYFNPKLADPAWAISKQTKLIIKIGDHVFYKEL